MASLVAQMVKYLPTMQETWVQSLSREDPLEKEMATHSSILQYCLENPMDGGAWQAMVPRVAKSGTQLKWLSVYASKHIHIQVRKESSWNHLLLIATLRSLRIHEDFVYPKSQIGQF